DRSRQRRVSPPPSPWSPSPSRCTSRTVNRCSREGFHLASPVRQLSLHRAATTGTVLHGTEVSGEEKTQSNQLLSATVLHIAASCGISMLAEGAGFEPAVGY